MRSVPASWETPSDRHVLMLSHHCCIRVIKQAHALRQKGWRVDSVSYRRPSDLTAFDRSFVATKETIVAAIAANGASIIHVHNEPDWLMRLASDGCAGRPVVYDCHDLEHTRKGFVDDDEAFAFSRADGIVNVSASHRDHAYSLHPWTVPEAVVMSVPLRKWRPVPSFPERAGVVYEGGLLPPGRCAWRDLSVPCAEFDAAGVPFDIYTHQDIPEYHPHIKGLLDYQYLMQRMTEYEYGFCGHDPAHPIYEHAMPNKVWEYAMCGVIPLFVNLPHAAEVFGSGIVATSTADAIAQMRECDTESMRADVYAHARYMDEEIDNTIALYEELL